MTSTLTLFPHTTKRFAVVPCLSWLGDSGAERGNGRALDGRHAR